VVASPVGAVTRLVSPEGNRVGCTRVPPITCVPNRSKTDLAQKLFILGPLVAHF